MPQITKFIIAIIVISIYSISHSENLYQKIIHKKNSANDIEEVLKIHLAQIDKPKEYFIANRVSQNYSLTLQFISAFNPAIYSADYEKSYEFKIQCNEAIIVGKGFSKKQNKSHHIFGNHSQGSSNIQLQLQITENVSICDIKYDIGNGSWQTIKLVAEEDHFPILKQLNHLRVECKLPSSKQLLNRRKQFFLTNQFTNMTCPQSFSNYETLINAEDGFNAKVEALIGQKLSHEFIQASNPYAEIDFSKVPQLDAIYLSSLVYRDDFYGNILARLLEYHAQRGIPIRIMVSKILQLKKDSTFFDNIIAKYPNIKYQEYTFVKGPHDSTIDYLNELHRDVHIKILATIDNKVPENNIIITGGRNIHDGFLYKKKPDHSAYPELVQYGKEGDENFVHWKDFEIKLVSPELTKIIYAQLSTVWNRDSKTLEVDSINTNTIDLSLPADLALNPEKGYGIRHFMTIPYRDGRRLEDFYVAMIESADKTIHFSSPYLRPTKKLSDAFERAINRGVKITIQTRIDLSGDTLDWLYTEVNKESINKFKDITSIYEWMGDSILHSKFMIIDQELTFIGSVNISRRSFVHDIESGFIIYGNQFATVMESIFQTYISGSRRVTKYQEIPFFSGIIINIFENEF